MQVDPLYSFLHTLAIRLQICSRFQHAIGAYHASKDISPSVKWESLISLDLIEREKAVGAILDVRQQQRDYEQEI